MGSFNVAIVGGSAAGLTLALHLEKLGIDWFLIERHREIAPQLGASITLAPNGLQLLNQLGCFEEVDQKAYPMEHVTTRNRNGTVIYGFDISDRGQDKIMTGQKVTRIVHAGGKVELSTLEGRAFNADVAVGADGIHSRVRAEMWRIAGEEDPTIFGEDPGKGVNMEYGCIFGISSPTNDLKAREDFQVHDKGLMLGVMIGLDDGDEAAMVKSHGSKLVKPGTTFADIYRNKRVSHTTPLPHHCFDRWHYKRIMCIGDSVHKVDAAFRRMTEIRKARVAALIDESMRVMRLGAWSNKVFEFIDNYVMWLVPGPVMVDLMAAPASGGYKSNTLPQPAPKHSRVQGESDSAALAVDDVSMADVQKRIREAEGAKTSWLPAWLFANQCRPDESSDSVSRESRVKPHEPRAAYAGGRRTEAARNAQTVGIPLTAGRGTVACIGGDKSMRNNLETPNIERRRKQEKKEKEKNVSGQGSSQKQEHEWRRSERSRNGHNDAYAVNSDSGYDTEGREGDRGKDNWLPRASDLIRLAGKHPLNAEAYLTHLFDAGLISPDELHCVRSHGSVPRLLYEFHRLDIENSKLVLSMAELKQNYEASKGFNCGPAAISCAYWKGPLLRGVLLSARISSQYGMDPTNDVMLAYEMNDLPLPPDNGYPVRLMVLGVLPSFVTEKEGEFAKTLFNHSDTAWYEQNLNSVIVKPAQGGKISLKKHEKAKASGLRVTLMDEESNVPSILFRHPIEPAASDGGWMKPSMKNQIEHVKQQAGRPQKQFTRQEVERHDNEQDCWIAVDSKVYDATSVLDWHPGGKAAVLSHAGRVRQETTDEFASIHDGYEHQKLKEQSAKEKSSAEDKGGQLVLQKNRWAPITLVDRREISEDTRAYAFSLPDDKAVLGLGTCQHIQLGFHMRQPGGAMSNILDCLPIGEQVELRGSTGEILYNGNGNFMIEGQKRHFDRVSLVLGGEKDILLRKEFDEFQTESGGLKGHVNEEIIKKSLFEPSEKPVDFLCGPPVMIRKAALPALKDWSYLEDKNMFGFYLGSK
ncbi:hypothetical protein DL770_002884 [Monosporascus sp. CRB-9-2]|nr:hypothetical protein DL770_002884 [Monosporascus sp. CRB-9-2]